MKNNIIFLVIIFGLISAVGCTRERSKDVAVRINQFVMSADEFKEEFQHSSYSSDGEGREKFLEDLINRKLLIQEAEREGLDKEQGFLREIERFWEKTLLKSTIDRKSKELAGRASVNEDEIKARYDQMINKGMADKSLEELYDQIKWQVLRERQTAIFNDWLDSLRQNARIEIKRDLLGIR